MYLKSEIIKKVYNMAQTKVTRKELREMHIGQTRIFTLEDRKKLTSARVTAHQLKDEGDGEWEVKPDYQACAVSITRIA
jgi:hypothetical protein